MGGNQQYLQPPDYDPRRLFPFGLSPIPEVPSEFASEVSSIASYSPTPSLDDSDTEAESVRSRGSIMYSGSCDSIKSNATLHGKSSSESDTETEHSNSSDEETEDEAEGYIVESIPVDKSPALVNHIEESNFINQDIGNGQQSNDVSVENECKDNYEEKENEEQDKPMVETHSVPSDMVSGAATASEIFRHLQATRGKQEVTTELAKILTVLKSTLSNNDKDSSSSDEESNTNDDKVANPNPTGKPPKPPQKIKFAKNSAVSPAIQARIRDLEANKPGNPKEEMNLLSKILVHLLCSCKNAAAAQELKRIIRQFKEVAKVAMEEGDDTLESLRSTSRASSRSSKRKVRSRTASGNSNVSGNSETDSMNTLTPGDSKSSGTDDETNQENNMGNLRFTSNVNCEKNTEALSCVSYTLTLPLKKEDDDEDEYDDEDEDGEYDDDDEWEWEYEDELEATTPTKNDSSGSSRNLTPSEAKSDSSTGSTRKIFNDMELGAYNSHSDPGNSNSHSTPITEEDDVLLDDDEELREERAKKKLQDKSENSEHLFSHLEETFKVLSDTYKIITTGNSPECDISSQNAVMNIDHHDSEISFEDILDGVSSQCVQLESEIMRSSRQSTAEPDGFDVTQNQAQSKPNSRPPSRSNSRPSSRANSRPSSRANSRPTSRANSRQIVRPQSCNKIKTPVPTQDPAHEEEEEDWGDEDEWEYYYEEESEPIIECNNSQPAEMNKINQSRPSSRILVRSRPASRQEVEEFLSRPASRQSAKDNKPESRPSSRIVKRPVSVASRPASRAVSRCSTIKPVEEEDEEEDWGDEDEWEYYYEEDYSEDTVVTSQVKVMSRPSSRQNSGSRVPSRQETVRVVSRQDNTSRVPSRQEVEQKRVPSRQEVQERKLPSRNSSRAKSRSDDCDATRVPSKIIVRIPSRNGSRPASRAKSTNNKEEYEDDEDGWEYYYEDDESQPANHSATGEVIKKPASRPGSRQSVNQSRPNSRSGTRPDSRSGSRPGSAATSRMSRRTTSALGNVDEEDEYEWYDDYGDDMELLRFSPTLTTAPTTRATSPFPDEKGRMDHNTGTGFSKRKMSAIQETEETTPVRTPTNRDVSGSCTPVQGSRSAMSKTPSAMQTGYLNPMAGVSVALAAEYLGQDAQQIVNSLPVDFIEENIERRKKHRHKHRNKEDDTDDGEDKKKRRSKKGKKFLPKVGVRELASRLEPQLFQDMQAGNKMIITKEEATGIIMESKRKVKEEQRETSSKPKSPSSSRAEEERKSVREMVQLMSNHKLGLDISPDEGSSPPHHSMGIPSISVTSQMAAPPIPPPPQAYYTSPGPQYPPNAYQPYPVDVHAQYSQYQQSPHSPYQQYPPPPQSPYHQYPPQQYYQGYAPPPPPPQAYQQYPQGYPQYHPQQMQPYPPYTQGYQPPLQQPIIYQSDSNPNQVKVVSGGQTTVVTMRQKNRPKEIKQKSPDNQRTSPNDSEAYGTGSTGSDQTEGQVAGIDHDEGKEGEEGSGKPHKRHSRLFKLLQDSDYTDSDADSRADYSRISMKNMEDNHSRESDIDSVCSGLEKSGGIERKHSFRSHKSSNKESDNESMSSGIERKISPNSVQNGIKHRRFMQLNLQTTYDPSSSELSTPNSPTGPGPERCRSTSKPPARVWNYHADDFESHAGVSDDSSYQSLQSMNSFDSIYDNIAGREVEEIMKRKVNRDGMMRYQAESPGGYVRASPKGVDLLRGSPKTSSPSLNRNSPKLEQELLELTNFPNSPGISLRQLHGHRSFYGGK